MHSTEHQTPDRYTQLVTGLSKIGLVLRHQAWKAAESSGLTPTQSQVLAAIGGSPQGWLSVSDVARHLAVTQPTASDAIAALERKRLVERARAETDARIVRVRITAAGSRRARETAEWPDALIKAIGELDEHEQGVFLKAMMKMIRSLQESGQIPTSRMCATCTYFRPHAHAGKEAPHHCAFVGAPLRETDLRLDCREHEPAGDNVRPRLWQLFIEGALPDGAVSSGASLGSTAKGRGDHT